MDSATTQQAVIIARQYYLEGLSKIEIGKLHDLSRFKVARILEESLESGLVQIRIGDNGLTDSQLSEALRRRYELRHAVVVNGFFADESQRRTALGQAAADLLGGLITAHDVLGIAWGRTLSATAHEIQNLPPCRIVQLTGIAGPVAATSLDLVRRLLTLSRGAHFPLYAPLVVSDAPTATALARQPSIRATMSQWRSVTVAMVAVGSWDANGSQLYPVLDNSDHEALARHDIAAEMCAMLFSPKGQPLKTSLARRAIAIPYAELMQVPEVIAVAGGSGKAAAVRSVLNGRAVTSVVTDHEVATQLLEGDVDLLPRPTRRRRRPTAS